MEVRFIVVNRFYRKVLFKESAQTSLLRHQMGTDAPYAFSLHIMSDKVFARSLNVKSVDKSLTPVLGNGKLIR